MTPKEKAIIKTLEIFDKLKIFFDAYDEHREEHGSFLGHPQYPTKMQERYTFMYPKATNHVSNAATK